MKMIQKKFINKTRRLMVDLLTVDETDPTDATPGKVSFSHFVENSPNPIFSVGRAGDIRSWNRACENVFQYGTDVIGQDFRMLLDQADLPTLENIVGQVFQHHRTKELELAYRCQDGTIRFMIAGLSPLLDQAGSATACVLANTDITDRRLAEQTLREREELYRQITCFVSDHIYVTSVTEDGRQENLYISPHVEAMTGYPRENFEKFWDFWPSTVIHPDDQEAAAAQFARLVAGQDSETEYRLIRANGEIIWVRDSGRVTNEATRKVIYGVASDITERKKRQRELEIIVKLMSALRRAPTRAKILPVILEQLLDLLEMDGAMLEVNDDNLGESIIEFAVGAWVQAIGERTPMDKGVTGLVIATKEPYVNNNILTESRLIGPDLLSGLPAVACAPLIAEDAPIGILWVGRQRDIKTDEVQLLTAIADIAANALHRVTLFEDLQIANQKLVEERSLLARRVDERTAELSAANAELARASRLKDEFLASISHELRTPLNGILGMSEALQEQVYGPLNDKQLHALTRVEESGRHLLTLINDILDLSKIEAGKLVLQIGPTSVEEICQSSLILINQEARNKRIKLSTELDPAVTIIHADQRRLKQILVNLLSNAVKFTDEGGQVGLEVSGEAKTQTVRFVVWDTGIGIVKDAMRHLFKPFVQLDSSLARHYDGTGLGLALVYRMVEMHGGCVSVESEIGQGSRFTVSLPWREIESEEPEPREPEPAALDEFQPNRRALSPDPTAPVVLLVEDNPILIETVTDYLQDRNYRVTVARDGAEGVERAREERPSIILMDIQMPGMDGLEATRRLRADPELAHIPIIALTALAMPGDRERCLAAGMDEYLSKPVSLKRLVEAIETKLNEAVFYPE